METRQASEMSSGWMPDPSGRAEQRWFIAGRPTSLVLKSDGAGGYRESYDRYTGPVEGPGPFSADQCPVHTDQPELPTAVDQAVTPDRSPEPVVDLTREPLPPRTQPREHSWSSSDGTALSITSAGPYTAVFVRALEDIGGLDTKQSQAIFKEIKTAGRSLVPGLTPDQASLLAQELTRIGGQVELWRGTATPRDRTPDSERISAER